MSIDLERINNIDILPINLNKRNKRDVLASEYFSEPFCNIFILAKKNSGKTTLIFNLLQHLLKKGLGQKVFFFVGTIDKDIIYEKIRDLLSYNRIEYKAFDSIINDEKVNVLDYVLENIEEVEKENWEYPENIFVFDDVSYDLQNKSISRLLKANRHYKAKVILSSQYITDITPASRLQLDYCLAFKNLSMSNLHNLFNSLNIWTSFKNFLNYYNTATSFDEHSFLYIDCAKQEFRVNFKYKIIT